MARYVPYLGFLIPYTIAEPANVGDGGPMDGGPRPGFCDACRRTRAATYVRASGKRMCKVCLDDAVRVRTRGRFYWRRSIFRGDALKQPDREGLTADERAAHPFDPAFWNRLLP